VGQHIVVQPPIVVGDVAVFVTDRSMTGMGAMTFQSAADAGTRGGAPAELALRLYAVDAGLRQIYVAMNAIVVRRVVGWDDAHIAAIMRGIEDLFVFYSADRPI
jgi:hypothetical protein